ncbi:MAG: NADH-quinone oxidoreductase subunit B family protein [Acidiferrobacter sp.]
MPSWTWFGLKSGRAATAWPRSGADGQEGVFGLPRFDPAQCRPQCTDCVAICPTTALDRDASRVGLDYGRCIACQMCVAACPAGALQTSSDWAFATRDRKDLVWQEPSPVPSGPVARSAVRNPLRKSLHIRHIDAGSCNGCESELAALDNPFYNLHRLGIFFTPSPRFADLLLVTGPVTPPMRDPLLATFAAMPEPRLVMATGTCAVSGAPVDGGYSGGQGLSGIVPVDMWLPGCPPNPAALIHALLTLLDRMPQRVHGGHYEP